MDENQRSALSTGAWVAILLSGLFVLALGAGCLFLMFFGVSSSSIVPASSPSAPAPTPAASPSNR